MRRRNTKRNRRATSTSRILLFGMAALISFALLSSLSANVAAQGKVVCTLDYHQTITVASHEYLKEGLAQARDKGAQCVILLLDTFGGDLTSTTNMIAAMETSNVPVVVYVGTGGKAWSAGAFLMMGAHVAAMAPGTVLGSCQPVSYSPLGGSTPVTDEKVINALAKYIREKAQAHGRNYTLAERFVRQNLNLGAEEANNTSVIDVLAPDLSSLIQQLNGRNITTAGGSKILSTTNAYVISLAPSIPVAFLAVISDPTISGLLFLVGLYALIYGLLTPGYGGEVLGGILIILSLIGMGFDFNIVAIVLIVIGAGLLIGEFQMPGTGFLGVGGVICIIFGSLILFPKEAPRWLITMEWFGVFAGATLGVAAIMGGLFAVVSYKALIARKRRAKMFQLEGETATVHEDIPMGETGYVMCLGELWLARSGHELKKGDKVKVVRIEGNVLVVELAEKKKR